MFSIISYVYYDSDISGVGVTLKVNMANVTEGITVFACVIAQATSQRDITVTLNTTEVSATG